METKTRFTTEQCARELLDVVPVVMRSFRKEMRRARGRDLTIVQFRALAFLVNNHGASLSDLADHIGLTLPSSSKLIDGLVSRKLVDRKMCENDRRRMTLSLTASGKSIWQDTYKATHTYLTKLMMKIPKTDQMTVQRAMAILRLLFSFES